jgi:hypothetical protein
MYEIAQIQELKTSLDQMVADQRIVSYNIKYDGNEWHAYLQPVMPIEYISINVQLDKPK